MLSPIHRSGIRCFFAIRFLLSLLELSEPLPNDFRISTRLVADRVFNAATGFHGGLELLEEFRKLTFRADGHGDKNLLARSIKLWCMRQLLLLGVVKVPGPRERKIRATLARFS